MKKLSVLLLLLISINVSAQIPFAEDQIEIDADSVSSTAIIDFRSETNTLARENDGKNFLENLIDRAIKISTIKSIVRDHKIALADSHDRQQNSPYHQFFNISAGASEPEDMILIQEALAKLPANFKGFTRNVYLASHVFDENGIDRGGVIDWETGNLYISTFWPVTERILVHEMTHAFQAWNPEIMNAWENKFWKDGAPIVSSPTDYGNFHPTEDMAESVAEYWVNEEQLKKTHPLRHQFIQDNIMSGNQTLEFSESK